MQELYEALLGARRVSPGLSVDDAVEAYLRATCVVANVPSDPDTLAMLKDLFRKLAE